MTILTEKIQGNTSQIPVSVASTTPYLDKVVRIRLLPRRASKRHLSVIAYTTRVGGKEHRPGPSVLDPSFYRLGPVAD